MQDVHIGGDYLSTVAGGHFRQNTIDNFPFTERVEFDTAQNHAITLRDKDFRGLLRHLHGKQPTGVSSADKEPIGHAVVDYAIVHSSFRPVVAVRSGREHHSVQISVIMPAFNEEAGIGIALRALTETPEFGPDMEIVVAANGCTDRTADVARSFGVRVVEIPTASKTAALNAADRIAGGDVRVYMDADVLADARLVRRLAAAVAQPGIEAAVPRPAVDTSASTWPVRAYYSINSRLPVFRGRLFGRGIIALSARARSRFGRFPEITADDMFLDAIVAASEKAEVDDPVRVVAPATRGELVRRVARGRDGNAEFWRFVEAAPDGYGLPPDPVPGPSSTSWLRNVVLRSPWLLPAAAVYVAVVLLAERKRRSASWDVRSGWGRTAAPVRVPAQRGSVEAHTPGNAFPGADNAPAPAAGER